MCEKQGRLRILVVDDEQKQRQILKILLILYFVLMERDLL